MQPSAHPPSPVRILLAEDEPDQQDLLTRVLRRGRPHVKVDVVSSASELDRSVRSATYDCIVLDYNLPDRTADEAMRSSRDFLGQTPVVVVSSSLDQDVVLRSARAGGVDFVKKTDAMQSDELWERVMHAINESIARLDRKIAARLRLESKDQEIAKLRRAQGQTPADGGQDAGA